MRHEKLGSLDCRVIESPTTGEDGLTVVLLHGYGAPGEDLVPLAEFLGPHRYVFPVAPLELAFGYDARAWWEIDMEGLERALSKGVPDDFRRNVPEGLPEARAAVLSLLSDVERRLGIPGERIVLGGFSQGAMLSMDVALRSERRLAGLAFLSGTIVAESEWLPLFSSRRGCRVFQSHGIADPLLPFRTAVRLRDGLVEAGLEVEWVEFPGAHELPGVVVRRLAAYLAGL